MAVPWCSPSAPSNRAQLPTPRSGLSHKLIAAPVMARRGAASRAAHPNAAAAAAEQQPLPSRRVRATDAPCIVKTKALVASTPGTLSLAQGIVHWAPPPQALATAAAMAADPAVSQYGPDEGLPALREALRRKIREENGLEGVSGPTDGQHLGGWREGGRHAGGRTTFSAAAACQPAAGPSALRLTSRSLLPWLAGLLRRYSLMVSFPHQA